MKYLLQRPRIGGGAGHSLKTWVFGFILSKQCGLEWIIERQDQDLKFHKDVSAEKWLNFFGLEKEFSDEKLVKDIQNNLNILTVPSEISSFNDTCEFINKNIKYYDGFDIEHGARVLNNKQDLENIELIKGWLSQKKKNFSKSLCDKNFFNISLAIRRGDRVLIPNLSSPNDLWFLKKLEETLKEIKTLKPINIFIFSETYNKSWHVGSEFKIGGKALIDWLNDDHIHPDGKEILKNFIDGKFEKVENIYVDERGKPNNLNKMFEKYNVKIHLNENIFTVVDTLIESDCIIAPRHGTANICKFFKNLNPLDLL